MKHMDWCDPGCDPEVAEGRHSGIAISVGCGAMTTFLTQASVDEDPAWLALAPHDHSDAMLVEGAMVPGLALAVAQHAGRLMRMSNVGDDSADAFAQTLARAFLIGLFTERSLYGQDVEQLEGE